MPGKIISINISGSKGAKKKPVAEAEIDSLGLKGDAMEETGIGRLACCRLKQLVKL
ncbi:MAG: hypothetical protein R6U35_00935 [Candidatus Humimicrobiaceae bacterium]